MIRDTLHTLGLTAQLLFCAAAGAAGANHDYTYGGFRPLEQYSGQIQGYTGYTFGQFGSGQAGQATENYRQQRQTPRYQQSPQYRFREMPGQATPADPGPRFRPDPRFDQERPQRGEAPRRWTGNDVIAPNSSHYGTDGRPHQPPQPYYPYSQPPAPQQHYAPDSPVFGFPIPGFMPFAR